MGEEDRLIDMLWRILSEARENQTFTAPELIQRLSEYRFEPMPTEGEVRNACGRMYKMDPKKLAVVIRPSRIIGMDTRFAIGLKKKITRLAPGVISLPNVTDAVPRPKRQKEDNSWLARFERYIEKKRAAAIAYIKTRRPKRR